MSTHAQPPRSSDLVQDFKSIFATAVSNFDLKLDPQVAAVLLLVFGLIGAIVGLGYIGFGIQTGKGFTQYAIGFYGVIGCVPMIVVSRLIARQRQDR